MSGKFTNPLAEKLYERSMDSWQDDEFSVDGLGWWAKFEFPMASFEHAYKGPAGALLHEDDYGFVEAQVYATSEELEKAWADIQAEYAEECEDCEN